MAPYHLRLGWQLWFAALSSHFRGPWLDRLLVRLLEGERDVTRMARVHPFPDVPPKWVRVMVYDYRYSTRAERRATGHWWVRTNGRELIRPRRLRTP